jgi:general secretion pathway protein D
MVREGRRSIPRLLGLAALLLVLPGCAARTAYHKGQKEARRENWDLAVAHLTEAVQKKPDDIGYKIALEDARIRASRAHFDGARKALAAQDLDKAADELEIAVKYDGGNKSASDDLAIVRRRILKRDAEKQRLADFESMKDRAQQLRLPLPVLSPRSPVPITLKFNQTSLQNVLDTLAKLAGVNVLYDQDYRDKKADVNLSAVTFQEALDRITFVNRLFYKVLDQNTLIVIPETPAKRRTYDEQVLRTFYLQNADATETLNLVKTLSGITKALANKDLQSISVLGTPDKVALAERVVLANDKAKGEVMIEVQILNVNTTKAKEYGLALSKYEAGVTFSPTGASDEIKDGFTNIRAHLLSSFNLADFVVSVPSSVFAKFVQTEGTTKILAAPRLRAAEGKKTSLKIGQEVPVPVTTFQATQTGGTTFSPATSFQYRNVGVNLDITPKVNPSGDISLELTAEFSLLGKGAVLAGQDLPTFLTRNVVGVLRLRDGETSLIGGLVQRSETDSFSGILGLQSVPVLNKIFTSRNKSFEDNEILISITPHILRGPKVVEEDLTGLVVGTEEIPKVEGARPPLFGPASDAPPPGAVSGARSVPVPSSVPPRAPLPVAPAATPPVADASAARPPGEATVPPPPADPTSSRPTEAPGRPAGEPTAAGAALPAPDDSRRVTVQLSSPETVKMGEIATVSLVIVGLRDVTALDTVVALGPGLEAVEANPGPLLTLDGATVGAERAFEAGRVRVKLTRATGVSGSGVVLVLRVRGLRAGTFAAALESLSLTTAAGVEHPTVPAPARVTVNP